MYQSIMTLKNAFKLVLSKGYKRYIVMPLLINMATFMAILWFGLKWLWKILHSISIHSPSWLSWADPILTFIGPFLIGIIWLVLGLLFFLGLCSVAGILASIIAAPFNSLLAEKILRDHLKQSFPEMSFLKVATQSLIRELQKILYYLPRLLFILLLTGVLYFIPILNILSTAIFLIFASWMLSFEYMDYAAETMHIPVRKFRANLNKHKMLVLSFGLMNLILFSIPGLNFICMPVTVAGAVLQYTKFNEI